VLTFVAGILMQMMQQLTGINFILYFGVSMRIRERSA